MLHLLGAAEAWEGGVGGARALLRAEVAALLATMMRMVARFAPYEVKHEEFPPPGALSPLQYWPAWPKLRGLPQYRMDGAAGQRGKRKVRCARRGRGAPCPTLLRD